MKKFFIASTVAAALLAASTSAFANSCTSQGKECQLWATGQFSAYKSACIKETAACQNRCKTAKMKFFVGVYQGTGSRDYPVDTCD